MVSVDFRFNLKGDMENWWGACNSSFMGTDWKMRIRPGLRKKIVGVRRSEAEKFLKPYLERRYRREGKRVQKRMDTCRQYWDANSAEIFARLKKITKRSVWPPTIYCFYTTFPRCPYGLQRNSGWLFITYKFLKNKKACASSILHEIMHFQFHKYFWSYCKRQSLDDAQIEHLKEAFTFLINEEFSDLVTRDRGYLIHRRLRRNLKDVWKNSKSFKRTLGEGISLMKGKYSYLSKPRP